jgi:hypothetical protein
MAGGVWVLAGAVVAAAGAAYAQYENPTTPGAIANPGSYQGSLALQQQERAQSQQMEQQNFQMQQRLNQTYAQPGRRGGGGGGGPPAPNYWAKPPLAPAKNPLLGHWRQGAHRNISTPLGGDISSVVNSAMAGGCDSIFGKGVVAFEPDSLQWVAPDGHEEILNHVAYRANGADVVVLTRDEGALPAMFVGFVNHDHAVVGVLNCTLERVGGAQRAALGAALASAPAAPGLGRAPAAPGLGRAPAAPGLGRGAVAPTGPGVEAAANLVDVSMTLGASPLGNARVWLTHENPAFALARAGIPVASESAALEALATTCNTPQTCGRALSVIGGVAIGTVKTDPSGRAQLPSPSAGRYYVVGFAPYRDKAIVWIQPVDVRGGATPVRLDASNGRPVG